MNAYNAPDTRTVVVVAAVQSGKTEAAITNPVLYYALYQGRDVLVLYPNFGYARTAWEQKIYPAILASPALRPLLYPKREQGQLDSGRRFRNGATLYMLGAESPVVMRTAEIILVDEPDYIEPGAEQRGGMRVDKIEQAIKRSNAFPKTRRIGLACTVTRPDISPKKPTGRIWQEYLGGDQQKPYVPCPHCKEYIILHYDGEEIDGETKGGFKFNDATEETARESAHYQCQKCDGEITNTHRIPMIRAYRWVKQGQTVTPDGVVHGEVPPNSTKSFWYNGLYVPWWGFDDMAVEEMDSRNSENSAKDFQIHQKVIPYEDPTIEINLLEEGLISSHATIRRRGAVPEEADMLLMGVDPERRWLHWAVYAFKREGMTSWLVDEGVESTGIKFSASRTPTQSEMKAIYDTLVKLWKVKEAGFFGPDGNVMKPSAMIIDSGYAPDAVYQFVMQVGQQNHFAVKGQGTAQKDRFRVPQMSVPKLKQGAMMGEHCYERILANGARLVHVDSDWGKLQVHEALRVPLNEDGCLNLFAGVSNAYTRQLQGEKYMTDETLNQRVWMRVGQNHQLDIGCYCFIFAHYFGARRLGKHGLILPAQPAPPRQKSKKRRDKWLSYGRGWKF
jgi:phage terminase large subunit GpA-like protein